MNLRDVGKRFRIDAEFLHAEPYGNGHINDTYLACYNGRKGEERYVHQRMNRRIFKDPVAVMDNIRRVTTHLRERLSRDGVEDGDRRTLTIVDGSDGLPYARDDQGEFWRTYRFIDGGRTYDVLQSPEQAFGAARAFGTFQRMLSDLPDPPLHTIIPDFHHVPKRIDALERAIREDSQGRTREVAAEIAFVRARQKTARLHVDLWEEGTAPVRVTHNDTKVNNVIIDDQTGEGVCVIDLDTVMPGMALDDFGDMVRTGTARAAEDERDLAKVEVDLALFEGLARGYLSSAASMLTAPERERLATAGQVITLVIGIRFLTDYIEGDRYFKTHRPGQNLDRCRMQFRMVASMEEHEEEMRRIVIENMRHDNLL